MSTNDDDRVSSRAELLPEEEVAGSDDPEAQAAAILEDSEGRVLDDPDDGAAIEERTSDEATPPT